MNSRKNNMRRVREAKRTARQRRRAAGSARKANRCNTERKTNMSSSGGSSSGATGVQPASVQMVVNRLWQEQCSEEATQKLVNAAVQQLTYGYSLMFPVMSVNGTVYMGVALVAEHDHRTRAIKIDRVPGTTHLAIFLLFKDRAQWRAQADKLIALWPERRKSPAMILEMQ